MKNSNNDDAERKKKSVTKSVFFQNIDEKLKRTKPNLGVYRNIERLEKN
jgi:hypothetical protein